MKVPSIGRRRFLRAVAGGSLPLIIPACSREVPPSERLNLGFIGLGKQGHHLLKSFQGLKNVEVLAVCDVDKTRREHSLAAAQKKNSDATDHVFFEEVLDREDIDAVVIATPDHWHALITLAALKAGKDVYCEKPLTHNIHEAIEVMKAVDENGRILQTGSLQRSMKEFRVTAEIVRNGLIGEIEKIHLNVGNPGKACKLEGEDAEPGLDWNRWLGPAPERPYHSKLSPRGVVDFNPRWRTYSEYGGGMITDWGAHHIDIAHWALGLDESGPVEILPAPGEERRGGQLVYGNGAVLHHVDEGMDLHLFGSDGEVEVARGKFAFRSGGKDRAQFLQWTDGSLNRALHSVEKDFLGGEEATRLRQSDNHLKDFLSSVASREKPICPEGVGGRTAIACHLLNLSYYHRQPMKWDPTLNQFADGTGDPAWLTREYRGPWAV